jgi:serine/threonine-protein kinase RsbW
MVLMEEQKLRIASRSENIILVEKLIEDVCEVYSVNEDYYGNILVALTEAVNNAIIHGNKCNPDKTIDIHFASKEDHLTFTVKDQGEGFDFNNLPDPTDPENIEKPNGRGVFLMRNLADKVEYFDNGRTVALNFRTSEN